MKKMILLLKMKRLLKNKGESKAVKVMNVIIVILVIIFIALLGVILYTKFFLTKEDLSFFRRVFYFMKKKNFKLQ